MESSRKQAVDQHVLSGEQSGLAGTLVILAGLDGSANELLGDVIIGSGIRDVHGSLNGVQLLVVHDGANVALVDLVIAGSQTAVADQVSASQLLIQHHATRLSQSVHDVIPIQLLLLIDSGRNGGALQQREDLFLLQLTLHVTLGTSLVLGDVREHRLDARERSVVNSTHHLLNPASVTLDELGRIVQSASLREQPIDLLDAVSGSMLEEALLQTAVTLGIADDGLDRIMAQGVLPAESPCSGQTH